MSNSNNFPGTITAQYIVQTIGKGVAQALSTNQLFLGVEEDMFKNVDIHPEYVTTVEVAKQLTDPDRIVSLETHMKELRLNASYLAKAYRRTTKNTFSDIERILIDYRFGKKDSQRLDILVRSSNQLEPPLLIAEAKLGVKNLMGIVHDISRVVRLLTMYNDVQLLDKHHVYGAVLFHFWEEGNDAGSANQQVCSALKGIREHLESLKAKQPWLNSQAGLLTHGAISQPVTAYRETYEDGSEEDVFAKESFTFAPGLVLLGNAADVNSAVF